MKKVMKLTAVIALLFVTTISMAAAPKLKVIPNSSKSITVTLDSHDQTTKISLTDIAGNVIFVEDVINQLEYSKRLDLSKLEDGNFFLKIENKLNQTIYTIKVTNVAVVINDKKEITKPNFRMSGTKVFLNLLNLDKKAVKIKIVDQLDRVVFEELIKNEMLVEKVFNFEKAFKGDYIVKVTADHITYYEGVHVK